MEDTYYINTPMPSTPGFVSPAPPSSPEPGKTLPLYPADLDMQSTAASVTSPLQTIPPLPDFPVSLERPNPLDWRYFFLGAPSAEDDSPQARLIREARDRAIRAGPRHYSVQFIPMTLFAVKKVESVRVEGREYSLSSYWIEEPQASLTKEVSTQTSTLS